MSIVAWRNVELDHRRLKRIVNEARAVELDEEEEEEVISEK